MAASLANGSYRFQNATDNGDKDYFTLTTTGQIKGAPLDASSDTQKWQVTKRSDGYYDIANVATGALLAVASPNSDESEYTLSVTGDNATSWDVKLSGSKAVLQATGTFAGKVADLSDGDRTILWEDNGLPNQRWIPVFLAAPVQPAWISVQGANIPANAVVSGYESDEPTLYVARAQIDGLWHPGKAGKQLPGNCRIPWGSSETVTSSYQVLVASPGTYKWVPIPDGPLDLTQVPKLIVGGSEPVAGTLYSIRGPYAGALIPGKAHAKGFWLGLNGSYVNPSTGREVLCYA